MKNICWKTLLVLALAGNIQSADLTSSGDWVASVSAANLAAGAGSDLQTQFESISGVTTLTISNAPGEWSLRARRNGTQWNSAVAVFVKRTSAGSGAGSITGGGGYVEVTATDSEIFTGSGPRSGVSLQFKLTGLSKKVSPSTYLSSIIFTVQ